MQSKISPTTKNKIFDLIGGKTTIIEFEQWVYNSSELENELSEEDHLELISFNYKKIKTANGNFRMRCCGP